MPDQTWTVTGEGPTVRLHLFGPWPEIQRLFPFYGGAEAVAEGKHLPDGSASMVLKPTDPEVWRHG